MTEETKQALLDRADEFESAFWTFPAYSVEWFDLRDRWLYTLYLITGVVV